MIYNQKIYRPLCKSVSAIEATLLLRGILQFRYVREESCNKTTTMTMSYTNIIILFYTYIQASMYSKVMGHYKDCEA